MAAPVTVTVHECTAPHRLVVEIPEGDGSWRVTVELAAVRSGTEVVFRQHLRTGTDAGEVEAGWSWYLDRLGASLRGTAMPGWAEYAPPS